MFRILTNLFPLWILICSGIALFEPEAFTWFLPYIIPALGVIMLGMGMTLTLADFKGVLKMPRAVGVGGALPVHYHAAVRIFDCSFSGTF